MRVFSRSRTRITRSEVHVHYTGNRLPGPPPRIGLTRSREEREGEMCGSTRIHILTLRLRGFASSREHRSPAKPLATASFFTQVQRRVAVKNLRMTLTLASVTPGGRPTPSLGVG